MALNEVFIDVVFGRYDIIAAILNEAQKEDFYCYVACFIQSEKGLCQIFFTLSHYHFAGTVVKIPDDATSHVETYLSSFVKNKGADCPAPLLFA